MPLTRLDSLHLVTPVLEAALLPARPTPCTARPSATEVSTRWPSAVLTLMELVLGEVVLLEVEEEEEEEEEVLTLALLLPALEEG